MLFRSRVGQQHLCFVDIEGIVLNDVHNRTLEIGVVAALTDLLLSISQQACSDLVETLRGLPTAELEFPRPSGCCIKTFFSFEESFLPPLGCAPYPLDEALLWNSRGVSL